MHRKAATQVEEWRRKLIDLTRRNRLLNFRTTQTSSLRIVEPNPDEIFARLVVEEKPWVFQFPDDEYDNPVLPLEAVGGAHATTVRSGSQQRPRRPNEIRVDMSDFSRLSRTLTNMLRRSESEFAERGVRILHVAFGLLEWKERGRSENVLSPILLVPAILHRFAVHQPPTLTISEEDIVLNPALEVKLQTDYEVVFPKLPEDFEDFNPLDFLKKCERSLAGTKWRVLPECWCSLFSFYKLVMYRDLGDHKDLVTRNPLVLALSRERSLPQGWCEPLDDCSDLDRQMHPKDSFTILDADSSQSAVISAVKKGRSILIQGPPGTGKSQTISNIIAEALSAGKKVLFVSDKMAALEVVYKRLKEVGLGHYILELHSAKTRRETVVNALATTIGSRPEPGKWLTDLECERLAKRRQQLNDYATSMHMVRESIGRSVYDVLGELTSYRDIADIRLSALDPASLNAKTLLEISEIARRLSHVWDIAALGSSHPWSDFTVQMIDESGLKLIRDECIDAESAFRHLVSIAEVLAKELGQTNPTTFSECQDLNRLAQHLVATPSSLPRAWLDRSLIDQIRSHARDYQDALKSYQTAMAKVPWPVQPEFWQSDNNTDDQLRIVIDRLCDITAPGQDLTRLAIDGLESIAHDLHQLADTSAGLLANSAALDGFLGIGTLGTLGDVKHQLQVLSVALRDDRPASGWFNAGAIGRLMLTIPRISELTSEALSLKRTIEAAYSEAVYSLDAQNLLAQYRLRYRGVLRWVRMDYYGFRRQIKACRKDALWPDSVAKDLESLSQYQSVMRNLEGAVRPVRDLLGDWYQGDATDCTALSNAVHNAREILKLIGEPVPASLVKYASHDSVPTERLHELGTVATRQLQQIDGLCGRMGAVIHFTFVPSSEAFDAASLQELSDGAASALAAVNDLLQIMRGVGSCLVTNHGIRLADCHELLRIRQEALLARRSAEDGAAVLRPLMGSHFDDESTDWQACELILCWIDQLFELLMSPQVPQPLGDRIFAQQLPFALAEEYGRSIDAFSVASIKVLKRSGRPLCPGDELHAMARGLSSLILSVRDLPDLMRVRAIQSDAAMLGLPDLLEGLRKIKPTKDQLSPTVMKAVLEQWAAWVTSTDHCLSTFSRSTHESIIEDFRLLDRLQWQKGVHHVVQAANAFRSNAFHPVPGGESETLYREIHKKRRFLPLRKLFAAIPALLLDLKPCLMMSPTTVSQFLTPQMFKFDMVVFDEASQIKTEDAIGSIYRSSQVVICGDERQLPPTTFFEQGMSEEIDEDDEDAFDEFESILKACSTIGLPEARLRWHYRSRHESLIAFSNYRFYSDRPLITFPSALAFGDDLGVKHIVVEDAVYMRGASKRNDKEAGVVADLVLEQLTRFPHKSLGVVAFSIPQKEAIEDCLEEKLRARPDLRRFFEEDESRLNGFFVKNLESVQGDERDVMVVSVGYGKDQHGRLTMNFGPLNRVGGERRLNVVITRAREKCIVVSSIRAGDFDIRESLPMGASLLRSYLEYAEKGPSALDHNALVNSGDSESPFEDNVAAEIRALGYDVHLQVGCARYRIDIGVIDPRNPGAYLLGVECDGATYHSSRVARDRDRLRQEILESLGWRIHRIWSAEWWHSRDREVERLKRVLLSASQPRQSGSRAPLRGHKADSKSRAEATAVEGPRIVEYGETMSSIPSWAKYYVPVDIGDARPDFSFHDSRSAILQAKLLEKLVSHEAPIHLELATRRIAEIWGQQRITGNMSGVVRVIAQVEERRQHIRIAGEYLFQFGQEPDWTPRLPQESVAHSQRRLEHIPRGEIAVAMTRSVKDALSISDEDLFRYVAKMFGFDRTGNIIRDRLSTILSELIANGELLNQDGLLSCPRR